MREGHLKYTVIRSQEQYDKYCVILEELVFESSATAQDEIELLTLLIEKWDAEHRTVGDADPIEILKTLMQEHDLKAKDMALILGLSKGTVSKILNYHKGFSKETIRKLSAFFKVSQETFNQPYKIGHEVG